MVARRAVALFPLRSAGHLQHLPHAGGRRHADSATNILTGVSGITALSPALSVADGRLVFSAYENDGYNIYALDTDEPPLAGSRSSICRSTRRCCRRGATAQARCTPRCRTQRVGLPPATRRIRRSAYKPKSRLDFAGQPTIGVGIDPFGTYAAGGVSFVFSDMLGNHVLATARTGDEPVRRVRRQLFYLNRTHRWNWGVGVDQTPYVSARYATGFDCSTGSRVYVESEYRILQIDRASPAVDFVSVQPAQRVEFSAGLRQIELSAGRHDRVVRLSGNQIEPGRRRARRRSRRSTWRRRRRARVRHVDLRR